LFAWAIATGLPSGVTTMSISSWTRARLFSSTIIANTDVPAETFPERGRTAFVATMPVPASPSGGHRGMPAESAPEGSSSFAPAAVSFPAGWPAGRTAGRMSRSFQPSARGATRASNVAIRAASQSPLRGSMGNMPEASPTPIVCWPVSFQWT
jgi:hypothetical protein